MISISTKIAHMMTDNDWRSFQLMMVKVRCLGARLGGGRAFRLRGHERSARWWGVRLRTASHREPTLIGHSNAIPQPESF